MRRYKEVARAMEYTFDKLVDVAMLQKLMDDFYMVTGIPTGICDNQSHMFTATGWKRACTHFHRVHPVTLDQCIQSDQYILKHLGEGPFVGYRCPHGLNDYAVPLFIEGRHLANVMTGQMFHEEPDLDFFRRQAKEYGFDEADYIEAIREIPIVPKDRIAHIMAFLMSLTEALAKVGLAQLHQLEIERKSLEDARLLAEERRQAAEVIRQSNDMLTRVMNSVPQAIFWKGKDLSYLGCNKVFAEAAGLVSPEMVKGKTDGQLPWAAADAESYNVVDREVLRTGQPRFHMIESLLGADGMRRMVDTSKVPLLDAEGQPYAVLGVFEDITERLRNEKELSTYRDHLEELVDERTAELRREIAERERVQEALRQAKEAAEAANHAKSAFLANMSHELRTPLNAVLGFTQILRNNPDLAQRQKDHLDIILRSGEHLLGLINDVLDISRIEAGQVTLSETTFDLSEALRSVRDMTDTRARAKGLQFLMELEDPLPRLVMADEKRLKQVILNLTGNAVKFTDEGGVAVRVREADGCLHFEVEDTGPGINPELLPRLFNRFEQGGSGKEGTGLGLYISRKLVELMGGSITARSLPGRGALFSFFVRYQPAGSLPVVEAKPRQVVIGLAEGQAPISVLVVEDTYESRLFLKTTLTGVGLRVLEAANGAEGVRLFEENAPDLILMDMRMPVMDGYEAIKRIKATDRGGKTPIISITASAFKEDREKVLAAGADEFLRKPVIVDELFRKIHELLGVTFLYGEESSGQGEALDNDALKGLADELPEDLVARLRASLDALDLYGFRELLPEVEAHSPRLAGELGNRAAGYEISSLAEILRLEGRHP